MSMKRGGGWGGNNSRAGRGGVGRTREGGEWGGGAISAMRIKKKKKILTALKITSISRKMTPFVGPVSSLLFKA